MNNNQPSYNEYNLVGPVIMYVTKCQHYFYGLGAIQIIRDTFLAYFRPPFSRVSFGDTGSDPPAPPPVWCDNFHFTENIAF